MEYNGKPLLDTNCNRKRKKDKQTHTLANQPSNQPANESSKYFKNIYACKFPGNTMAKKMCNDDDKAPYEYYGSGLRGSHSIQVNQPLLQLNMMELLYRLAKYFFFIVVSL